jgi:DNA-binding MarR family transcriptional regulator
MKDFPEVAAVEKVADQIRSVLFTRLIVFSDVINRYVDIELKDSANWVWIYALIVLTTRGNGTMTLGTLARYMLRSNHAITKLADSLEKEGLVKRHRANKDRRTINVKITEKGLDYILKTLSNIKPTEKNVRAGLEGDEDKQLAHVMLKIWKILAEKVVAG